MNIEELKEMLRKHPRDLDDKCDAFKSCTAEEYKALALYALEVLCKGSMYTRPRYDNDGWAAHHISKAIFEEQDFFDPYADQPFLDKALAICPWYIGRYLEPPINDELKDYPSKEEK